MKTKKLDFANETPAARTKRLGPLVEIMRFVNEHKGRAGNKTRIAVMKCLHVRSVDMTTRAHVRCSKCRAKKPADVRSTNITRFVKKAA